MWMICAKKSAARHAAPRREVFRGTEVVRGQPKDVARVELSHALAEQNYHLSAAHVACIPFICGKGKLTLGETELVSCEG